MGVMDYRRRYSIRRKNNNRHTKKRPKF